MLARGFHVNFSDFRISRGPARLFAAWIPRKVRATGHQSFPNPESNGDRQDRGTALTERKRENQVKSWSVTKLARLRGSSFSPLSRPLLNLRQSHKKAES